MRWRSARFTRTESRSSPNHQGNFYSNATPDGWFRELMTMADPPIVTEHGIPARIYDLRHAHVIEVINRWVSAGRSPTKSWSPI